ncbi:MAG: ABC transporter permease [Adhaeribacter sp.]
MNNQVTKQSMNKLKPWLNRLSLAYLLLILLLALFANWLPLGFAPDATMGQPIFQEPFQWQLYKPGTPFHWLGTDNQGRDLLTVLVYGARTAFLISLPAMALATLIGVSLGMMAGYFGDTGIKWPLGKWLAGIIAVLFFFFYACNSASSFPAEGGIMGNFFLKVVLLASISYLLQKAVGFLLVKLPFFRPKFPLPFDFFLLKIIELLGAVPRLLLVLCLAAFFPPAIDKVILLGMLTFWPSIARLTRAEMLKQKGLPYVEAAVALGFSPARVLTKHALPNILVPILVAVTFGICNLIALESTLSFLGYGLPPETPSWGQAINGFRANTGAWWLLLFPGLSIILVVLALQNVNNYIIRYLQPK